MNCPHYLKCKKAMQNICDEDQGNFCQKKFRLDYLFQEALINEKQRYPVPIYRGDTDDKAYTTLENTEKVIEEFIKQGINLYIHSKYTGNGKTTWAIRLLSDHFNNIWYKTDLSCKGLFISVPKFLLCLKENISQKSEYIKHIKENVLDADLVIWDDIGSKNGTEFEIENILSIINNRIDEGKSNIYTSNLNNEELVEALGPRLASRIIGMSMNIEFNENDKRGLK